MSRWEYSNYVTLLPCNQFYRGRRGPELSQGGVPPPLATPQNRHCEQRRYTTTSVNDKQSARVVYVER